MCLTKKEIETIVRIAREIYGWNVEVYLFGSRTDDIKRGGDIDLLVRNSGIKRYFRMCPYDGKTEIGSGRSKDRCHRGL